MEAGNTNLTPARGPSVWDKAPGRTLADSVINRAFFGVAGLGLLVMGLQRRTTGRRAAAVGGAVLLAVAGTPGAFEQLQSWAVRTRWRWQHRNDRVTDESALSFPASDSPSWTPTTGAGVEERRVPVR